MYVSAIFNQGEHERKIAYRVLRCNRLLFLQYGWRCVPTTVPPQTWLQLVCTVALQLLWCCAGGVVWTVTRNEDQAGLPSPAQRVECKFVSEASDKSSSKVTFLSGLLFNVQCPMCQASITSVFQVNWFRAMILWFGWEADSVVRPFYGPEDRETLRIAPGWMKRD